MVAFWWQHSWECLPFFALTQYYGWAYEETTLTIRALRLMPRARWKWCGLSCFAHKLFKVSEISGLRAFATLCSATTSQELVRPQGLFFGL